MLEKIPCRQFGSRIDDHQALIENSVRDPHLTVLPGMEQTFIANEGRPGSV
jgi:hypothetical protein